MRVGALIAIPFLTCLVGAQTKIQALAAEIEASAAREVPSLGLDTRIRAADRLRSVEPETARHLLDSGLAVLEQIQRASYQVSLHDHLRDHRS